MLEEKFNVFYLMQYSLSIMCGDWSQTDMGSDAGSATLQLCGLGQITQPL